jgi:rSAM/selenodomain-associated transferase 1
VRTGAGREPARPLDAAVALFAKAPVPGRVKTRLSPPLTPEEAARVARALLTATIETLVSSAPARWTLFLDGEPDDGLSALAAAHGLGLRAQDGRDLGARLAAAFRHLRGEGAARVLAVGADAPTLPPGRLAEAVRALDECDVVLGPTEDGGYYLVGTASPREEIFRDIPWSTASVLSATLARAEAAGLAVRLLPPWYDVDSVEELRRLRGELGDGGGYAGLWAALDSLRGRF